MTFEDGEPAQVYVHLYQDGELVLPTPDPNANSGVYAYGGMYEYRGLAPGTYTVHFGSVYRGTIGGGAWYPEQWFDQVPVASQATPVIVQAGRTASGVDAVLRLDGGSIEGTVTQLGDHADAYLWVIAYLDGEEVDRRPIEDLGVGQDGGLLRLPALPPGTYTLGFAAQDPANGNEVGEPFEWYEDANDPAGATQIVLEAGDHVTGLEVVIGETEPEPERELIHFSAKGAGWAGDVMYRDEDIMSFDPATGDYELFFDGSDVGLTRDLNGFELLDDGSVLMTFAFPFWHADLGRVDDSDIVRFVPTSTGADTAGALAWFLDGSTVGLTTAGEDIDAIAVSGTGEVLISTVGNLVAGPVRAKPHDLVAVSGDTAQSLRLAFDASGELLQTSSEKVDGASFDADSGALSLKTSGAFNVDGASGNRDDVFTCAAASTDPTIAGCEFSMTVADLVGRPVNGIHVGAPKALGDEPAT